MHPLIALIGFAFHLFLLSGCSTLTWYSNADGTRCGGRFKDGVREGQWQCYYLSGQRQMTMNYRAGKKNGSVDAWLENGVPDFTSTWKDGLLDGPFVSFYANGQPHLKSGYAKGLPDGEMSEWREDGSLLRRATYHNGKIIEEWQESPPQPEKSGK